MTVRSSCMSSPVASTHARRRPSASGFAMLVACLAVVPAAGIAQVRDGEACKTEAVARDKLVDFGTAFAAAEKRAKAWAADAAVARFTHTTLGPIDADARSANWYSTWYAKSIDAFVSITIANGSITCWAMKGAAGRMPQLKADWYKDAKRVLAIAAEKGGAALMKEGYEPRLEMSAGSGGVAYWYVNYEHPTKRHGLQVIVDANTGVFRSALK